MQSTEFQLRDKLIPMVVALPLFLQNMDTSIMATALPTISEALGVNALQLNLAITAYLISLAIFLPASGWLADKFGPRRIFCWAIGVFAFGSLLCAASDSLYTLVAARVLQGMGGAMMVPVGRLILIRRVTPAAMVSAMIWFTVPPVFGRMIGPLVGGAVVTWFSWRWIFLINLPVSAFAIAAACMLIEADEATEAPRSFDAIGFLFLAVGLASLMGAMESAASRAVSGQVSALLAGAGALAMAGYYVHSRHVAFPLIDLSIFKARTFFASVVSTIPIRLAIGASPFMLPLLFQLGFGLNALHAGLLTMCTALGSLMTRVIMRYTLSRVGFKPVLLGASLTSSLCYMGYGLFTGSMPTPLMAAVMVTGGLANSLVMVSLHSLAYTEVPRPLMGQATSLQTMVQQVCASMGVLMAVELLRLSVWQRGGTQGQLVTADFHLAFLVVGAVAVTAFAALIRLPKDIGAQMR